MKTEDSAQFVQRRMVISSIFATHMAQDGLFSCNTTLSCRSKQEHVTGQP